MAPFEGEKKDTKSTSKAGEKAVTDDATEEKKEASKDWKSIKDRMEYYMSPDHLMAHVQDTDTLEISKFTDIRDTYKIKIPNPLGYTDEKPLVKVQPNDFLASVTFQPTKFVVLELFAALICALIFIRLGRMIKDGDPVKGRFWNMLEAMVLFVRDEIARPAVGVEESKQFLPFLWTVFFFILGMNLLGMIPYMGTPTGSISVTAALALSTFVIVLMTGFQRMGFVGFWKAQAPHVDVAPALKVVLVPMIWGIEVFGLFIKHMVLAVRLIANMFAGHLVLAVFIGFIAVTWYQLSVIGVIPISLAAATGISLLELLVALIQAYVFAFLSALFIGAAVHPH